MHASIGAIGAAPTRGLGGSGLADPSGTPIVWARTRFDIEWSDLAHAALVCLSRQDPDAAQRRLEARWLPSGGALACYSVRSGFDLLLRALDLPRGSEVLFSAINVAGMLKVVERLGLVPVPVDLDADFAAPRLDALERAVTARSRVLVVAHLFGSRIDLDPILAAARRHGLFVIEDCAQAFDGPGDVGHAGADASLFSFGPLKTASALGGALARIRDPALLARMRAAQARDALQTRREYGARLVKFAAVKALTYRVPYTLLVRLVGLFGLDLDAWLTASVRGIAKQASAESLRRRPSLPLLALLDRRLVHWRPDPRAARSANARALLSGIQGLGVSPGARNERHTFWACTVLVKEPAQLVAAMRSEGFDAAPSASLRVVPAPAERRGIEPVRAHELLSQLVFLPCYPALRGRHLAREAAALRRALEGNGAQPIAAAGGDRPSPLQRLRSARRRLVKTFGKRFIRATQGFLDRQSTVGDGPLFESATFPAIAALEASWRTIRTEIEPLLEDPERLPRLQDLSPDQARIATDDRWRTFPLYAFGYRAQRNCALCPETARLVEAVPGLESAWFSILLPGYRIPEHRGITKGLLTSLLGVKLPDRRDRCAIRVGSRILHYQEGRSIIFDDTHPHEIWNDTDQQRVVLIVDFRRPLRPLGRLFNDAFLWAFKRTGYVKEARQRYAVWEDAFHGPETGTGAR
jgi:dTDP-4-amino-4,6-dideoxygalactose transaminase